MKGHTKKNGGRKALTIGEYVDWWNKRFDGKNRRPGNIIVTKSLSDVAFYFLDNVALLDGEKLSVVTEVCKLYGAVCAALTETLPPPYDPSEPSWMEEVYRAHELALMSMTPYFHKRVYHHLSDFIKRKNSEHEKEQRVNLPSALKSGPGLLEHLTNDRAKSDGDDMGLICSPGRLSLNILLMPVMKEQLKQDALTDDKIDAAQSWKPTYEGDYRISRRVKAGDFSRIGYQDRAAIEAVSDYVHRSGKLAGIADLYDRTLKRKAPGSV